MNISLGTPTPIYEVIDKLSSYSDSYDIIPYYKNTKTADRYMSNKKIIKNYSWNKKLNLDSSLFETFKYYKKRFYD